MALLTVAVGCSGFIYAGEQSAMLDIANNFAGTLMGGINALGNTMGFVAPMIVGAIIEGHNDQDHWDTVFWISAAVYSLGTLTFLLLGTAEEQPWNRGEYDKSVGASADPQQVSQPRQETTTVV